MYLIPCWRVKRRATWPILIVGAVFWLFGCSDSNTPPDDAQRHTGQLMTELQVFERTQSQRVDFGSALKRLAGALPAQVSKGATLDTSQAHCGGSDDTATFIAEERLEDPLADPSFQLGLANLCNGTDVMQYLRKPAPGPSAPEDAHYDPKEYEKLFQVPFVVVMRIVKYVQPKVTFKDSREKREAKARKELCPHLSPEDCERAVKFQVDQQRPFFGPESAGEYEAGRVVMDMFLADVRSGKILGGVRFEASNSEKVEFESAARGEVSDDRFAEVLLADLQKNALAKARAAVDEAFHLFH